MRYIPKFIRQLVFDAITTELAHLVSANFPTVEDLEAKLVSVIAHALGL
jgi:hypothetical protein